MESGILSQALKLVIEQKIAEILKIYGQNLHGTVLLEIHKIQFAQENNRAHDVIKRTLKIQEKVKILRILRIKAGCLTSTLEVRKSTQLTVALTKAL